MIENNKLILNDFDTISQLSTFIKKKDSYKAESGYQDDLIMALISALFFLLAVGLDIELVEGTNDLGKKILEFSDLKKTENEEEPPTGFFNDEDMNEKVTNDFDWL